MNRVTGLLVAATLAAAGLTHTISRAFDEELQTIPTRPGVTQALLLLNPTSRPVASVILFAGGQGRLALSDQGIGEGGDNFLVRTRTLFAERGLLVAVVDVPSDRTGEGLANFRSSEAHAQDIAGVIAFLKQRANVPVWLIGTSMGTLSAANAAVRVPQDMDGIVLASSVTRRSKVQHESLMDVDLKEIRLPTLFVHHKNDACTVTPYADIHAVMQKLKRAPKVGLLSFEGGDTPRSGPCAGLSYHGFLGIEPAVVDAIARWIKAASGGG
ncbi:MAG: alpha/beta hydrolase [Candidatus Methylomirabilales bacterium]